MKMFVYGLIIVLVILSGLYGLVRWLELKSVFYPSTQMDMNPSHAGLEYEDIYPETADGVRLFGWWIKNPLAKSVIIIFHGNAGNISDRLLKVKYFHDLGFEVVIVNYRGYGLSQGSPSEQGVYLDAQAVYDWVKGHEVLTNKITGVYGGSLGGAVAIDLAVHRQLDFMIIDATMTSAVDMAKMIYPYLSHWMMSIKFNSIDKIASLSMPKIFIHGKNDQVIPFWMGEALYSKSPMPKHFIMTQGSHYDAHLQVDEQANREFQHIIDQYQWR